MSDTPRTPSGAETANRLGAEVDQLRSELAVATDKGETLCHNYGTLMLKHADAQRDLTHARALLRDLLDSGTARRGCDMEWECASEEAYAVAMSSAERESMVDGRCPTCRQRDSRVREHEMEDGSAVVWHCNVKGCANAPRQVLERSDNNLQAEVRQ